RDGGGEEEQPERRVEEVIEGRRRALARRGAADLFGEPDRVARHRPVYGGEACRVVLRRQPRLRIRLNFAISAYVIVESRSSRAMRRFWTSPSRTSSMRNARS